MKIVVCVMCVMLMMVMVMMYLTVHFLLAMLMLSHPIFVWDKNPSHEENW